MSDICSSCASILEPTKTDDDEWNRHADRASLASCRNLENADPRVGVPGAQDLLLDVLDDQHVGDDCYKT